MGIDDVLGMNRRNIDYIMELNRREHYVLVDDKLTTKAILAKNGIATAPVVASCDSFFGINDFLDLLARHTRFVVKPSRGSGGGGIVVVKENPQGLWRGADGATWDRERQREHVENVLYGTFSLDSTADTVFAEDLIDIHPDLGYFTNEGLPDIRIIVCRGRPVASMLRVPTKRSHGKANLHAGGFAVGIEPETGLTGSGWYRGRRVDRHPETGVPLARRNIPFWEETVAVGRRLPEFFPLGYMGVDFAIDARRGPLVLELNARPGLEVQNVLGRGMRSLIEGGTA